MGEGVAQLGEGVAQLLSSGAGTQTQPAGSRVPAPRKQRWAVNANDIKIIHPYFSLDPHVRGPVNELKLRPLIVPMAMMSTVYSAPQAADSAGRAAVDATRRLQGACASVSPCGMELQGHPLHCFLDEARGLPDPALRVPHPRAGGTGLSTSHTRHVQRSLRRGQRPRCPSVCGDPSPFRSFLLAALGLVQFSQTFPGASTQPRGLSTQRHLA